MSVDNLVGQTLGQYQLRSLLGAGGMGAVYRAWQETLRREVAVKVLPTMLAHHPDYLARFMREAQTAAGLEHAHIVPIYDYGTEDNISFVAMRMLTGGTLADRLRRSDYQPTLREIASIITDLASALDYAHSRSVIHRDIKAGNIMFDEHGTVFLLDFGIAKLLGATSGITGSGAAIGTPDYMAPEQWRGDEQITQAVDQYALGVLLYAMLTRGRMPYTATTPYALMAAHLQDEPEPIANHRPDLPAGVAAVLHTALAKRATDRFPSVGAFAAAFTAAVQAAPDLKAAYRETPPPPPRPTPAAATPASQLDGPTVPPSAVGQPAAAAASPLTPQPQPPAETPVHAFTPAHAPGYGAPLSGEAVSATQPQAARPPVLSRSSLAWGGIILVVLLLGVGFLTFSSQQQQTLMMTALALAATDTPTPTPSVPPSATPAPTLTPTVTRDPADLPPPTAIPTPRRLAALNNRTNWVTSLVFSPDGAKLVTASADGRARLWDVAIAGLLGEMNNEAGSVLAVDYNPNGFTLATGNADGSIKLWLPPNVLLPQPLLGHEGEVTAVRFSPDGTRLASAGVDGTVRLWDLEQSRQLAELTGHDGAVTSLDFSPDGAQLVSGGADGTVRLWDAASGDQTAVLRGHTLAVWAVRFSPDGSQLASAGDDSAVILWDVVTGSLLYTLRGHTDTIYALSFSPDATLLASGSADRTIQIWDAATGTKLSLVISHEAGVLAIAFSPDGTQIASGGEDGTWRIWTVRGAQPTTSAPTT